MSVTTVKIVMQGLLALVPNNESGRANHMTVLMLDGNHSHGVECVRVEKYPHKPKLLMYAENLDCGRAGCDSNQGACTCEGDALTRKEIWLEIHPQPQPPFKDLLTDDPPRALPENRQEAAGFGYVANMGRLPFNLALNDQYLSASPLNLVARFKFPFESITPCELARRFDGGKAFVHALGLRALGSPWQSGEVSQAMAQRVVASVTIPDPGTGTPKVILHLRDLEDETENSIPLQPNGQVYWVGLSNTADALPFDHPCDDGVARHFSLFYELVKVLPQEQLIPHVRLTQSKPAEELDLQECKDIPLGLDPPFDRPICPLVMFNQPKEVKP